MRIRFQGSGSAGRRGGRVAVLYGAGLALTAGAAQAQQFAAPVSYLTGAYPQAIARGDFNEDGIPDLVIGDSGPGGPVDGRIEVLFGNGDGTFRTGYSFFSGGGEPDSIVVKDFNKDGHLDLAVANYGGSGDNPSVAILLGTGYGTFEATQVYKTEKITYGRAEASDVVAGDFDGDGQLDLAVSENPTGVTIYHGKKDGKFVKGATYHIADAPSHAVVKDFNHDGRLDLAVTGGYPGSVSILLGNGDGTFQAPVEYQTDAEPDGIRSRDFNGDGHPDLVVANAGSSFGTTVSVLLGRGDGTFEPAVSYSAGAEPVDVAVADFNGDGQLDLAVANAGLGSGETPSISLLLGKGDGTFGTPTNYASGPAPVAIVAADLNQDGSPDVAVVNSVSDATVHGAANVLLHTRASKGR